MGLVSLPTAQRIGRLLGKRLASKRTRSREVAGEPGDVFADKSEDYRETLLYDTLI